MRVELTKFRVKPGKSERVDEWFEYMHNHMDDVLLGLEGEKMYVETIFRERFDNREYLYWYSVQDDDNPEAIEDAYIDQKHIDFMDECIDKTFRPDDMEAEVMMMPEKVRDVMK